jgi:hypothetical protein
VFHKPFYAGQVVSEHYGIALGEVRGRWEPVVTLEELQRGIEILHKHDGKKLRIRRYFYLLRNLLWIQAEDGTLFKLYVSTPSGRTRSYSYYVSRAKSIGQAVRFRCNIVDDQIPGWLSHITADPPLRYAIREIYESQIHQVTETDIEQRQAESHRCINELRTEEAKLARLHITGDMTEETYKQLRSEWQEKMRHAEAHLKDLEQSIVNHLDDLDIALVLLARASELYQRLDRRLICVAIAVGPLSR